MTKVTKIEELAKAIDNGETNIIVENERFVATCYFATEKKISNNSIEDAKNILLKDVSPKDKDLVEAKFYVAVMFVKLLAINIKLLLRQKEATLEFDMDKSTELSKYVFNISHITK